ncbi:PaaI family thioesterase [Rhodococcus opacus]|nr:PaaI family thioesterase [Rhodococcus opacus]RZL84435.1 MAG: PaaI family thioesterase [Rhodococcus sp. (in: high G+C Gram-positive bacteria)]
MARTGAFWDGIEGRTPMPQAARTLGFELLDADPDAGTITVQFEGAQAFTNPFGEVLGGFLAAMLYDTLGPALLATLPAGQFIETLDLQCSFTAPARPGRLVGQGRVVARDADIATLDGSLIDHTGTVVATATATARVVVLDEGQE